MYACQLIIQLQLGRYDLCVYCIFTYIFSITGIILHFDNSDLSDYYFIDPHWLYDVFCQVCTTSVLISNDINCEWSYRSLRNIHSR